MIQRVQERGSKQLTPADWSALKDRDDFWRLVDNRVLTVIALRNGGATLTGTSYVGRVQLGDTTIELYEKVPGALLALLAVTTPSFRTVQASAPGTELGETMFLLVNEFINQVQRYVGSGREWNYAKERHVSSLLAGRLNTSKTVQLRARGIRHQAVFEKTFISHSVPMNKVLATALQEIETLSKLVFLPPAVLSSARTMALFFEDCLDPVILDRSVVAALARDLEGSRTAPDDKLLISLAGVILTHSSFDPTDSLMRAVPFSWFVNLEGLFEKAVFQAANDMAVPGAQVSKGAIFRRSTFHDSGQLKANPDLVICDTAVYVGDVKYKIWERKAGASDLYQLIVHAETFDSRDAFLVYPSNGFEVVDLGTTISGVRVRLFAVDVRDVLGNFEQVYAVLRASSPRDSTPTTRPVAVDVELD